MKHIIICGGDQLGKNSLIKGILEALNHDNVIIRHFGKPPKGLKPRESLDYQFQVFYKEAFFIKIANEHLDNDDLNYFDNTIIWNRSHLGEYVYAQMFRGIDKYSLKDKLLKFEGNEFLDLKNTYLITLTADPLFFLSKEDGKSLSKDKNDKTTEMELFKEVHKFSSIKNKK